jgi:hypothetical protein
MNCAELAAALERTLFHERDPEWVQEARSHAKQCPSCARKLELHRIEEHLSALPAVVPSGVLLERVMDRIAHQELVAVPVHQRFSVGMFKDAAIFVGAATLAVAYLVPATGESWLSILWPANRLVRIAGISAYLAQHPPWVVLVAGAAALLIVLGLAMPERQGREDGRFNVVPP